MLFCVNERGIFMLRIAVCDDMEAFGRRIAGVVKRWSMRRQVNVHLKQFFSGEELLADMEGTGYFDIVFMDIELGEGMNGLTAAAKVKEFCAHCCLIFLSQYDYYKNAYQVHPFHYLDKASSNRKIMECLDQAEDMYRYLNESFAFRFGGISYSLLLKDILYFVSDKRVIRVCVENGSEFMFYGKLDELEQKLMSSRTRFVRIHQSFLINGRQVEQCHSCFLIMRNKEKLPISRKKRSAVMRFHMELLEKPF